MRKILPVVVILLSFVSIASSQDSLLINSVYSTTENCGYKTKDIFIAWWDKEFDYSSQAEELLNTLELIRNECLNDFHMADPPNYAAGYYYNVYIHNGHDLFPDGWAMGQGTDSNGYPFLTIPIGYANTNNAGLQHEGFHVFQYSANSPGYAYSGDSQWYIEATANWYAALNHPDEPESYVTATAVTYNPQVPMWYTYNNREPADQGNWQRYCHQYGMNIFINYLTDVRDISPEIIVGGFFARTQELPQEYLYKHIGPENFCDIYGDFAAHNVGGFEFFPPRTAARSLEEIKYYGDMSDVHPIVESYRNSGTGGEWYRPSFDYETRAWSYNVYKILNSQEGYYTFQLEGDSLGSEGALAEFRGRVVIKNGSSVKYFEMEMSSLTEGRLTIPAEPSDEEIFLAVVSTPLCFRGNQHFPYQVKIDWSELAGLDYGTVIASLGRNFPNPFVHTTTIPYELSEGAEVVFSISDIKGSNVMEINEGLKPAGKHNLSLNTDRLSSGIYYYTIKAGSFIQTRQMVLE